MTKEKEKNPIAYRDNKGNIYLDENATPPTPQQGEAEARKEAGEKPFDNEQGWEKEFRKRFGWIEDEGFEDFEDIIKEIRQLLQKEREETIKGKFFNKVEINEEVNIPKELLNHIRQEYAKELIGKIEGMPSQYFVFKNCPFPNLKDIGFIEKEEVLSLIKPNPSDPNQ